jgi:DNA primase
MAEGRIIIPVYFLGKMVGCQARFVGERDWKTCPVPKYFNIGLQKSAYLYNWDQAKLQPLVVLVEGVSDVWSVGPAGMALFGHTLSLAQSTLVRYRLQEKLVVCMLDSDAADMNRALAAELKYTRTLAVDLPAGKDPGDLPREEIWGLINRTALREGVGLPGIEIG